MIECYKSAVKSSITK